MQKFIIALIWIAVSALLVKYSLYLAFDYSIDFLSSAFLVLTTIWFVGFFKRDTKSKS
jgi:membrane protein implicated in regulation of membrane protease activity